MKKILGILLLGSLAQAQTSNTTTSAAATPTAGSNTAALETTATLSSPFGFKVISENAAPVSSLKDKVDGASSTNSFGLSYKLNDSHAFEVRAIVRTKFNEASEDKISRSHLTQMADPTLHYNYTSDLHLAGSEAIVFANRYYVPTSQDSMNSKSNGIIRSIMSMNWDLNPRFNIEWGSQMFIHLNKDSAHFDEKESAKKIGSDSVLRLISGPAFSYNWSDKLSTYYSPYIELASTNYTRGNFAANDTNAIYHEVGLNIKAGIVEIKPYVYTTMSAVGKSTYEDFGSDGGTYYNLDMVAKF